jgi:hypothetical protein
MGGGVAVSVSINATGGGDLDKAMADWFMSAKRKGYIQITAASN